MGAETEPYVAPRSKLKLDALFTKQCQQGPVWEASRTQKDPKKSSFLIGV